MVVMASGADQIREAAEQRGLDRDNIAANEARLEGSHHVAPRAITTEKRHQDCLDWLRAYLELSDPSLGDRVLKVRGEPITEGGCFFPLLTSLSDMLQAQWKGFVSWKVENRLNSDRPGNRIGNGSFNS